MRPRLAAFSVAFASACALVAGCSSTDTTGTGGSGAGAQGGAGGASGGAGGGVSGLDPECVAFCAGDVLDCTGPDTEVGSGTVTAKTATGCSATASLPASGTIVYEVDCSTDSVCVSDGMGCAGQTGACYSAAFQAAGFAYTPSGCAMGGLACVKK